MHDRKQIIFATLVAALAIWAVGWAVSRGRLPPADFTFVNGTEIESIDPAVVTGQPEGRIIHALFEGLVNWRADTLEPIPGVAERWEISPDRLTYTFHLRADARWSDGSPVTAHDFAYSFRRFLDPLTAAQYSFQLWYVKNAEKYTTGADSLEPGDAVEVELEPTAEVAARLPGARGKVIRGKLVHIDQAAGGAKSSSITGSKNTAPKVFVVEIGGKIHKYSPGAPAGGPYETCRQVLLDFNEVGIKVLDDRTLRITLTNPTPYFLSLMGFYPLFPVQRGCVERFGTPEWTKPENVISNGAYRLEFRRIRDRIRLVKSETYWNRANVRLGVIDALAVESATTALNLYMTGAADWISTVPSSVVKELIEQQRADFQPSPELTVYFYRINVTKQGLSDPRVRRALALALDKRDIVATVTQAGEIPARSFVPPGMLGYTSPQAPGYDVRRAKELLAEAGYAGGQGLPKIEILYNTSEDHAAIAQLIQAQWTRNLGIDVGLRNEEWNSYLASQRQLNYAVSRSGWIGDYVDPNTFLDMFVSTSAMNQTGWANARYDELVAGAAREPDPKRRMQMLHDAEQILLDEMPIIPIYFRVTKNMVRPYVKGFHNNLQDVHPLDALWIDEEEKKAFFSDGHFR